MSQQVVDLGRRRSHGSIPIGIDESDLYTLDTSWPDGQLTYTTEENRRDLRKSTLPRFRGIQRLDLHHRHQSRGPISWDGWIVAYLQRRKRIPFRFDEMSKKEINVQLSNADPDDPPCRPMRDLSGRSGRAIAVSRDPLSPIALDASKVSIVGLRQQLVNGCTRTVGDDDHPLRIT